jgi:hypothetical protein
MVIAVPESLIFATSVFIPLGSIIHDLNSLELQINRAHVKKRTTVLSAATEQRARFAVQDDWLPLMLLVVCWKIVLFLRSSTENFLSKTNVQNTYFC